MKEGHSKQAAIRHYAGCEGCGLDRQGEVITLIMWCFYFSQFLCVLFQWLFCLSPSVQFPSCPGTLWGGCVWGRVPAPEVAQEGDMPATSRAASFTGGGDSNSKCQPHVSGPWHGHLPSLSLECLLLFSPCEFLVIQDPDQIISILCCFSWFLQAELITCFCPYSVCSFLSNKHFLLHNLSIFFTFYAVNFIRDYFLFICVSYSSAWCI